MDHACVCSSVVLCVSYCTNTYEFIRKCVVYELFCDLFAITYMSCCSWSWAIRMVRSWICIKSLMWSWGGSSLVVDPGVVKKCSLWFTDEPKIMSVGETPVLVFTWVFMIYWTNGKYFGQFLRTSSSDIIAVRYLMTSWFVLSTIPFSSWEYGCIVLCVMSVSCKED